MARHELFELGDQNWFPQAWREYGLDILGFYADVCRPADGIVPMLRSTLERLGCKTIVDLGSGSGGLIIAVLRQLEKKEGYRVNAVLTDKFPNLGAFEKAAKAWPGRISFLADPVEAHRMPVALDGFRTMFNLFHHFDHITARAVIANAVERRRGIGIFEFVDRSWVWWTALPFSPLFVWAITPFLRPFRVGRLAWTYLLPVIPLFVMVDGLLSCLRSYGLEELRKLASETGAGYEWSMGRVSSFGCSRVTYLMGWPTVPKE